VSDEGARSSIRQFPMRWTSVCSGSGLRGARAYPSSDRSMELLQDAVVVLLNVPLLGMGFVFLYRVWEEIVAFGNLQEGLSNIIFVVITIELYRLSVHYLRDYRVDLNILVEVGVSAIIQKVILVRVDKYTMQQLAGISLILVSLVIILWVSSSVPQPPRSGSLPGREHEGRSDDQ
jgi:uncharacterized membrane protein (DUF373 family)